MTTYTTSRPGQTTRPDVEAYVRRCLVYFDDLPADVRASLEHDVREIVSEVAAELDGEPADLVGPPDRFASDLRAAAGLPLRDEPEITISASASRSPITILLGWLRNVAWPWLKELGRDLLPALWVARGLVIPVLIRPGDAGFIVFLIWVLVTIACVVSSVILGRRGALRSRRLKRAGLGLIAVVFVLVAFANMESSEPDVVDITQPVISSDEFGLPEQVMALNATGTLFAVYDAHTGEPVFVSSELTGDELVEVLESTPVGSSDGFRVESYGSHGTVESRVPTWDGVIALAAASFR